MEFENAEDCVVIDGRSRILLGMGGGNRDHLTAEPFREHGFQGEAGYARIRGQHCVQRVGEPCDLGPRAGPVHRYPQALCPRDHTKKADESDQD